MQIGRFRYIAWVKCLYRVAGKASALGAGKAGAGWAVQICQISVYRFPRQAARADASPATPYGHSTWRRLSRAER